MVELANRIRFIAPLVGGQVSTMRWMVKGLEPEFVTDHEVTLSSVSNPPIEMNEQASWIAVGGGGDVCVGASVGGIEVEVLVGA